MLPALISMLSRIMSLVPILAGWIAGRQSAVSEQNEKVINIKSNQLSKAVNPVTSRNLDDRLRDDDNW